MKDVINTYYQALVEKDVEKIKSVITDEIFGVRTLDGDKLFSNEDLYNYCLHNELHQALIHHVEVGDKVVIVIVTLGFNGEFFETIQAKVTIKDGKISKVYETKPLEHKRYKAVISYDGSNYYGYQKQHNQSTIQGTLEDTITEVFKLQYPVKIASSGRTDKGVHAYCQVIHFDTSTSIPTDKMAKLLNSYLPDDIYIKNVSEVEPTFHSRFDVSKKEYLYKISFNEYKPMERNYVWHTDTFDVEKYTSCLQELLGTHDFQTFTKKSKNSTVRTLFEIDVTTQDGYVHTLLKGSGFLRYMVRNIIGAAVMIASNKTNLSMTEILARKDVNLLKDKAPAEGLYLYKVSYQK